MFCKFAKQVRSSIYYSREIWIYSHHFGKIELVENGIILEILVKLLLKVE